MPDERKVVSLNGGPLTPAGAAQPIVVEILEELLASAKRGEITAIGFAFIDGGGAPNTNWAIGTVARDRPASCFTACAI